MPESYINITIFYQSINHKLFIMKELVLSNKAMKLTIKDDIKLRHNEGIFEGAISGPIKFQESDYPNEDGTPRHFINIPVSNDTHYDYVNLTLPNCTFTKEGELSGFELTGRSGRRTNGVLVSNGVSSLSELVEGLEFKYARVPRQEDSKRGNVVSIEAFEDGKPKEQASMSDLLAFINGKA
tara:strand:- start:1838 stop:2383 length:546 start_codon:yes stop_codon:yes gene_type:complete